MVFLSGTGKKNIGFIGYYREMGRGFLGEVLEREGGGKMQHVDVKDIVNAWENALVTSMYKRIQNRLRYYLFSND